MFPADLPEAWRELALQQRDLGADPQARTLEWCADTLEGSLQDGEDELLNLQEAGAISGYSRRHLGRLMKAGAIPNSGTPDSPRLLRSDLPRKPGHGIAPPRPEAASSIVQVARVIATSSPWKK